MNIDWRIILASTINFVIFYFILKKFVFNKTLAIMNSRREEVEASLNKAKDEEERAKLLKQQNQQDLLKYKNEGLKLVEEYKAKADSVYKETIEESRKEAEAIKEVAMRDIEREKAKASHEIKQEVIELSMKIAEKVLEREIDENNHRQLIDDFIAKVGN